MSSSFLKPEGFFLFFLLRVLMPALILAACSGDDWADIACAPSIFWLLTTGY